MCPYIIRNDISLNKIRRGVLANHNKGSPKYCIQMMFVIERQQREWDFSRRNFRINNWHWAVANKNFSLTYISQAIFLSFDSLSSFVSFDSNKSAQWDIKRLQYLHIEFKPHCTEGTKVNLPCKTVILWSESGLDLVKGN